MPIIIPKIAPEIYGFLLAFTIAGFNESAGLVVIVAALLYRRRSILAGAALGTFVVLIAPGNAIRATYLQPIGLSAAWTLTSITLLELLINTSFILPIAFIAGGMRPQHVNARFVLILLAALILGIFPTAYAVGLIAPRTLVLPTAALIGLVYHAGQLYGRTSTRLQVVAAVFALALAGVFAVTTLQDTRPFHVRAGVDGLEAGWVRDCLER